MPVVSARKRLLSDLLEQTSLFHVSDLLFGKWDGSCETTEDAEDLEMSLLMLSYVQSERYLVPRIYLKRKHFYLEEVLPFVDEREFLQEARMSKRSFYRICDLIRTNRVFHSESRHPQAPVEVQFMIAVSRFGTYGNGAAVGKLARSFAVGRGTVDLYTNRIVVALLTLEHQTVVWPDLKRTILAFFIAAFAMELLSFLIGVFGCWRRSPGLLITTGTFMLIAFLLDAGALAIWHGVDYMETEKMVYPQYAFYPSWPPVLQRNYYRIYSWSFMLAWIGCGFALLTALFLYAGAGSLRAERRREKERNAQYIVPAYGHYGEKNAPYYAHAYQGPYYYYNTNTYRY